MEREIRKLTNSMHMVSDSIVIGSSTPIKDLTSTGDISNTNVDESYFDTEVKDYKIYTISGIGWPDPFPEPIPIKRKYLQREKKWLDCHV
jgi:hypothetical protein